MTGIRMTATASSRLHPLLGSHFLGAYIVGSAVTNTVRYAADSHWWIAAMFAVTSVAAIALTWWTWRRIDDAATTLVRLDATRARSLAHWLLAAADRLDHKENR